MRPGLESDTLARECPCGAAADGMYHLAVAALRPDTTALGHLCRPHVILAIVAPENRAAPVAVLWLGLRWVGRDLRFVCAVESSAAARGQQIEASAVRTGPLWPAGAGTGARAIAIIAAICCADAASGCGKCTRQHRQHHYRCNRLLGGWLVARGGRRGPAGRAAAAFMGQHRILAERASERCMHAENPENFAAQARKFSPRSFRKSHGIFSGG